MAYVSKHWNLGGGDIVQVHWMGYDDQIIALNNYSSYHKQLQLTIWEGQ